MNFANFTTRFLLSGMLIALCAQSADAVTTYRGSRNYFTLLSTNIKFPIFTKEFQEGTGVLEVGGVKQIWLDQIDQTLGFRLGRERIRPNGAGLGTSLTYWHGTFGDESFLYQKRGQENHIAEYRQPTHTYLFLDLNAIYIAWESDRKALGFYGLASLIGDREEYTIDKYILLGDDPTQRDPTSISHDNLDLRFGFGIGTRIYMNRLLSFWFEKRWIVGERFSANRTFGAGGLFEGGRQKTLYVPFNSLGLAIGF